MKRAEPLHLEKGNNRALLYKFLRLRVSGRKQTHSITSRTFTLNCHARESPMTLALKAPLTASILPTVASAESDMG